MTTRDRASSSSPVRPAPLPVKRLLVVSSAMHYDRGGTFLSYGPYTREIDIWADLFEEVVIAAPCRTDAPPADCIPFTRTNIVVRPQREVGGNGLREKIALVAGVPAMALGLAKEMRRADAIHVRCPGNLGGVAAVVAPLFSKRLVAKYAGQWNDHPGENPASRWQRRVLSSRWWRGPVTVYGDWPNQPPHVVSFFTSMMTGAQVDRARQAAATRALGSPLRVLFCGSLQARKRVDALIDAVKALVTTGFGVELTIVGDGEEREALRARAGDLVDRGIIRFVGALPFDESLRWYERADCLVLPSRNSEGWPKVIAEAMCHGLVCVGVAHGHVPSMLAGRGIVVETGSASELADALRSVASDPARYQRLSTAASAWACQFSLETLQQAIRALLVERWDLPGGPAPSASANLAAAGHHGR